MLRHPVVEGAGLRGGGLDGGGGLGYVWGWWSGSTGIDRPHPSSLDQCRIVSDLQTFFRSLSFLVMRTVSDLKLGGSACVSCGKPHNSSQVFSLFVVGYRWWTDVVPRANVLSQLGCWD